ncbi:DUF551 domain-containing protein [Vreelandella venusta]|uniref:DUF551 domain-containing protein n=1 Tax=Vreelandella venusta TaxID=44935 RepID=UPI0018DAEC01|nr:DUF551 domain-containing protein [Halomonas venusta]QPI62396.1 DUF551 domain-containing protein [Halomonas venusta]
MSNWKITGPPRFFEGVGMVYPVTKGGSRFNAAEEDELKALLAGWISVDERLPEKSHKELALWNGRWSYVGKYLGTIGGDGEFYNPHDDRLRGITHWMPLPAPPTN